MLIFPQESERLTYQPINENDMEQLGGIYNSNPFYLEISERKPQITLEEVRKEYLENRTCENEYTIGIREKEEQKLIGVAKFILCNPHDNNPWLGLLMLHKEKQNRGFAKEFLNTLINWYRENGYVSLHLGVLEKNQSVIPFYEKCGFVTYEERDTKKYGKVFCMSRSL